MSNGDGISAGEEEKVLETDRSHGSRTMRITPLKILSREKLTMQRDDLQFGNSYPKISFYFLKMHCL